MRTDGRTDGQDMMNLIVVIRKFANTPERKRKNLNFAETKSIDTLRAIIIINGDYFFFSCIYKGNSVFSVT